MKKENRTLRLLRLGLGMDPTTGASTKFSGRNSGLFFKPSEAPYAMSLLDQGLIERDENHVLTGIRGDVNDEKYVSAKVTDAGVAVVESRKNDITPYVEP